MGLEYLQSAIQHYQQGNLLEAKQACENLATHDPNNALAIGLLATVEKVLGNLELAEKLFEKSLNIDPNQSDILNNYAGLLINKEEFSLAFKLLDRAISIAPKSAEHHSLMGCPVEDRQA